MDKKRMQDGAHSFAFRQAHNDTLTAAILSKIAQNTRAQSVRISTVRPVGVWGCTQSEQFRSAILLSLGDDDVRDEPFFSLFQVL
jgi:hypothetical protein